MGKYQYWKMDNDEILEQHIITATPAAVKEEKILGFFEFTVRRMKDIGSQREQLEISAKVQGDPSGTIVTNLIDMENDMPKLRAYGVVLARAKYVELCHLLNDNYYYFDAVKTGKMDNVVTDEVTKVIFAMFCEYIEDNAIPVTIIKNMSLYNIPLKDFNSELSNSQFRAFNFTDIKEALLNKGYTVANKGKFDYVVSVDGEKVKMVSFKKECVDIAIEND